MRKTILFALIGLGGLVSAQQQQNNQLKKQLENEQHETSTQFDFYTQQKVSNQTMGRNTHTANDLQKVLQEKKSKVSFFFDGKPYYLKEFDTDQIKNSNTDALQNGTINGLNGSFNGNGIHISVFDGGRVFGQHRDFGGANSTRVTQKESSTVSYSAHATGVTGMIGGIGHTLRYANGTEAGNTKGIAPEATFDSYSFYTSILDGENTRKDVLQKLLGSLANISNHSYGSVIGWSWEDASTDNAGDGWYWNGIYDPNSLESFDLNGTYFTRDRGYDNIVYNNPSMIVVKSAGNSFNDGPNGTADNKYYASDATGNINGYAAFTNADRVPDNNCATGYDCIGNGSLAKNIIIVGSTAKITNNEGRYTQSSDVEKSTFSSAGPRDDGAIKPDIAGVGSDILHASTSAAGSNSWSLGSGTSYSAPQVTGIIGLWTEVNKTLFNNALLNASSAKTLLVHSALEAGTEGPDPWYGWGFANAKKGAELLVDKSNNKIIFEDKTLENTKVNELLLESNGSEPLKVTISWIDPSFKNLPTTWGEAYNDRTSKLVNDLDLKITNVKTKEVFYPWKLDLNNLNAGAITGDNTVDNVEQVLIKTPAAGIYKVEVSHKGNLVNNDDAPAVAPQNYSIIASGYSKVLTSLPTENVGLYVYPTLLSNTENIVTISVPKDLEGVSIYNMAGRLLKSETISGNTHELDFSSLPQGVYIINIKLSSSKEPLVRKVLKR